MAGVGNLLEVGHDYAPGAQPGPWEQALENLLRLVASPAALALLGFAIVVMVGYVLHRRYIGRLAPELPPQSGGATGGGGDGRAAAFAELRRRRGGAAEADGQEG